MLGHLLISSLRLKASLCNLGVLLQVTDWVKWWSGHTICLVGWLGPQVWLLKSMFLSFRWGGDTAHCILISFPSQL